MRAQAAWIVSWALVLVGVGMAAPPTAGAGAPPPLADERGVVGDLAELVGERLTLMPQVAAAKWSAHQPITDPAREAVVIAAAGERARAMGLAREPVEAFFRLQIRLARDAQEALTGRWRRAGYDYAGPVPDLSTELRPRLDALTTRLLAALYVAAPALARGDREAIAAALAHPALERFAAADREALIGALLAVHFDAPASPARARAAGILRIGTPADYAPYSVSDGAGVRGIDIDLSGGLAAQLGLQPVYIRTSWRTLVEDLSADRFDLAVGGVSITPARLRVAEASVALARSGKTAIGRCVDRSRYPSAAAIDAAAVTVVENPGGTNESFARGRLQHARLVIHPDNRTVFEELLAGRADVMYTDEVEVALAEHAHPELCRLLPEAFEPADKAFLAARGSGWIEAANPWLAAQVDAGVPAAMLREYLAR